MAYSIINVSRNKPKTYDAVTRLQKYIEEQSRSAHARDDTPAAWRAVREDFRLTMTHENYDRWIATAQAHLEDNELIIGLQDHVDRQLMERRLDHRIHDALDRAGYGQLTVRYEVAGPARTTDLRGSRMLESRDDWAAYTQHRLAELGITPRQGKESTRYSSPLTLHYTMSSSPAFFRDHPELTERWVDLSANFIRDLHGPAQILGIGVNYEQSTAHVHASAIPINDRGRLSASSFTRTKEQLETLHSLYNGYLRDHGLPLERGHNVRLERALAASSPDAQQRSLYADDISLGEVLERLEADRDTRDPHRWLIGDRIIQVHDDQHGFTEIGPHGIDDGHGAIDLVIRLRQEGEPMPSQHIPQETPLQQHTLAVDYLAVTHPDRIPGGAPPLVPHAPEPRPMPPLVRESIPFGRESRWEPGQFIIVDTPGAQAAVATSATGWGRVAAVAQPEHLLVDELDEAIAKGWMVDIASGNEAVWTAVQERYADLTSASGRQIWRSAPPGGRPSPAREKTMEPEHGPIAGPEMTMGLG